MVREVLTDKQQKFLDVLFDPEIGGDPHFAMKAAGYSENMSLNMIMQSLRQEILDRTENYVLSFGPKAVAKLVSVLDNPSARGSKEIIAAAKEVLDRAGVVKKEKLELSSEGPVHVVILPPKNNEGSTKQD